jgi:hypothetical protein
VYANARQPEREKLSPALGLVGSRTDAFDRAANAASRIELGVPGGAKCTKPEADKNSLTIRVYALIWQHMLLIPKEQNHEQG